MINIKYRIQHAKQIEIHNLLLACDNDFIPKLSSNLDLYVFSEKIYTHTVRFEAHDNGKLIGLLSAYLNDKESGIGFINHISILQKYKGNGISNILMKNSLEYAKRENFNYIRLEVSKHNSIARKLYTKYDFSVEKDNQDKLQMIKNLNLGEIK